MSNIGPMPLQSSSRIDTGKTSPSIKSTQILEVQNNIPIKSQISQPILSQNNQTSAYYQQQQQHQKPMMSIKHEENESRKSMVEFSDIEDGNFAYLKKRKSDGS